MLLPVGEFDHLMQIGKAKEPTEQEIHAFLRSVIEPISPEAMQVVRCGMHSGIPDCCIAFWLKFWRKIHPVANYNVRTEKGGVVDYAALLCVEYGWWAKTVIPGTTYYLPCPACLMGQHIVLLHACDCRNNDHEARDHERTSDEMALRLAAFAETHEIPIGESAVHFTANEYAQTEDPDE